MKYKFNFDNRLKNNYYSTNYFLKTIDIVKNTNNVVSMQFIHFSNEDIVVCGIDETIQLLKFVLGENFSKLEVLAQEDGNIISSNSPLLVIKGEYKYFGQLENIIDGILARRCSIATNVYKIKQKINSNQDIIFMADRNDSYFQQPYDAYPAHLLGVKLFVTNAQVEFFKEDKEVKVIGTMPHALIQQFKGDLKQVIKEYNRVHLQKPYALIDYHNNVISELESIKSQLNDVIGVRIDTSKNNIDFSLEQKGIMEYGVNHNLVKSVREWLDNNGYKHLKIIVSSGINDKDIETFAKNNTPIDYFGIGGYFLTNSVHVSADLVELNGEIETKTNRFKKDWSTLKRVE